ncbi:hypothetical protein [Cytobacillus gottheilii]|uniref:hypothetical protein n=1 Tax=Cytobacillus gottheilii TaxID=859144 RepID=UPI0009BBA292|nr:hypothetical protein [Cytobacillus gottheilii]
MMARNHLEKLREAAQLATIHIGKPEEELTELDIKKSLGSLDEVLYQYEAAVILLREKIYEIREKEGKK